MVNEGCIDCGIIKDFDMKKNIFFFLVVFGFDLYAYSDGKIQGVENFYRKPLELVQLLLHDKAYNRYDEIYELFSGFNMSLSKLLKKIDADIKQIQKNVKNNKSAKKTLTEMQDLSRFLKKHKLIYNAIFTHNVIRKTYQQLFDMIDCSQDVVTYIDKHREFFCLQDEGDAYLRVFLGQVKGFAHQISKFEDYVHSNYVDLKLQNYVFKIELIKLRNAILFDKRYKLSK